MVDLSRLRNWDASRAVQRRGGEAAMVSTLQWEAKKLTTWRENQGNFKAGTFSQSERQDSAVARRSLGESSGRRWRCKSSGGREGKGVPMM